MEIIEEVKLEEKDLPVHIEIPWKVDVGIVPSTLKSGRWSISEVAASFLIQSSFPGEGGNIVIYGHI